MSFYPVCPLGALRCILSISGINATHADNLAQTAGDSRRRILFCGRYTELYGAWAVAGHREPVQSTISAGADQSVRASLVSAYVDIDSGEGWGVSHTALRCACSSFLIRAIVGNLHEFRNEQRTLRC